MPHYRIAGLTVAMQPQHNVTLRRAEKYRTDAELADITLVGDGDAWEEHAALAQSFYEQLLSFDGFLLHASAVAYNGKAYLFSAPSGTGKSTHAAYWCSELGAVVINDDKPAIRLIDGAFYACGTPFSGKHDLSASLCVPLGGIAVLSRGQENTAHRLSTTEALWSLLNQTLRPEDTASYMKLLSLVETLLTNVPVMAISCTNDPTAAHACLTALTAE